jgi:hypothetical protein
MMTPRGKDRDQQAHAGSDDQESLNQAFARIRVPIAQCQQAKLFAPEIADRSLKLIVERFVRLTLAGIRCRVRILGALSPDDCLSAQYFLGCEPLEAWKAELLAWVVRR